MKPRRTKTPQIKRNWMRGVKLSGNKFANMYLFFLLPRFLPAAVRWLTGSEARPNTFCAAHTHTWAYKLTSNDDETESLTNPKWSCHVCCEELSHAAEVVPRAVRRGRAAVPPGERKTFKPRYLQRTPAWTRGRETGERVRLLALTRKQFFLPQDTISEHSHCT